MNSFPVIRKFSAASLGEWVDIRQHKYGLGGYLRGNWFDICIVDVASNGITDRYPIRFVALTLIICYRVDIELGAFATSFDHNSLTIPAYERVC